MTEEDYSKLIRLPDYFTLLNAVSGLLSILFSISEKYITALIFILVAVVMDFLDGKMARFVNRDNRFGKELDSLADIVSFGVAPAVFAFMHTRTLFAVVSFAVFLLAGILRLARYNSVKPSAFFSGMPITLNGVIIPAAFFLEVPLSYYPFVFLALAVLMLVPVKIRRIF